MDVRRGATVALAIGIALALVSLLADPLGIGEGGAFGWKQAVGTAVGVVVAAAAWWLRRRAATSPPRRG